MLIQSSIHDLKGNWLQDTELVISHTYKTMEEVSDVDAMFDWDTLATTPEVLTAQVKNSLAYTFKY